MQNKRTKKPTKKNNNNTKLEKRMRERERNVLERIQNVTETCKVQIEAPAKDKQEDEDLIKLIYIHTGTYHTHLYICIYPIYMCMPPPHRTQLRCMH